MRFGRVRRRTPEICSVCQTAERLQSNYDIPNFAGLEGPLRSSHTPTENTKAPEKSGAFVIWVTQMS